MPQNDERQTGVRAKPGLSWGVLASRRGDRGKTVTLGPSDLEDPEWINFNLGGAGVFDVRYRRSATGTEIRVRVGGNEYVVRKFPDRSATRLQKRTSSVKRP